MDKVMITKDDVIFRRSLESDRYSRSGSDYVKFGQKTSIYRGIYDMNDFDVWIDSLNHLIQHIKTLIVKELNFQNKSNGLKHDYKYTDIIIEDEEKIEFVSANVDLFSYNDFDIICIVRVDYKNKVIQFLSEFDDEKRVKDWLFSEAAEAMRNSERMKSIEAAQKLKKLELSKILNPIFG